MRTRAALAVSLLALTGSTSSALGGLVMRNGKTPNQPASSLSGLPCLGSLHESSKISTSNIATEFGSAQFLAERILIGGIASKIKSVFPALENARYILVGQRPFHASPALDSEGWMDRAGRNASLWVATTQAVLSVYQCMVQVLTHNDTH